jgi:hypothetical protein
MPTDFEFRITLDSDEQVDLATVRETLLDVERLLKEIERELTGERSKAHWRWAEAEVDLGFVASVNGVTADQLEEVIEAARNGFERASLTPESAASVEWPSAFNAEAKRRAANILRRLTKLERITIGTPDTDPLTIERANIGQVVQAKPSRRRVHSAVEGVLRMIAGGEKTIRAGIRERGTGISVTVTLDAERWHEQVREWWDRRVVVEGQVAYSDDGRPLSIVDVSDIRLRPPGRPLREFEGAAPGLTGTSDTDQFLDVARGDE